MHRHQFWWVSPFRFRRYCCIQERPIFSFGPWTTVTVDVNTTAISSTSNSPNFTEWAEDITEIFDQKFPNFTEWAEDLVYEVNTNVTQSFPNFTEWAEHVVEMIDYSPWSAKILIYQNWLEKFMEVEIDS